MTNKQQVALLRKRMKQNPTCAKHFHTKEALRLEGSAESRRASKVMNVQYHGARFTQPGDYFTVGQKQTIFIKASALLIASFAPDLFDKPEAVQRELLGEHWEQLAHDD